VHIAELCKAVPPAIALLPVPLLLLLLLLLLGRLLAAGEMGRESAPHTKYQGC